MFSLEIYPKSAVLWDSLGEINSILGNKQAAIDCYKNSLSLDPENENARKMIKELKN